jgi:exosortase A
MSRTLVASSPLSREATVLALIASIAAFVCILYASTFASMAAIWQSSGYHHGLIVPPICAYLLWRLRGPLAATELRPCVSAIVPLTALVGLWFVARQVGVQVVEFLAAVALIPAAVLAFLGWRLAWRAMFPLLFLLAAVPIGDGAIPYLMQITAEISTTLLRAAGVPVFREGQFLSLPGGVFEIARVCAGLAYLTAGTVIALLFSYFTYESVAKRFVFVAVAAAVMIVTNGIRAFVIMYVASATDMRYLVGHDHVLFGWILFGLVVGALIYAGGRFADQGASADASAPAAGPERARLGPWVLMFGLLMLAATAQPLQTGLSHAWLWVWPVTGLVVWALYKKMGSPRAGAAATGPLYYRSVRGGVVLGLVPVVMAAGPGLLPRAEPLQHAEPLAMELPAIDDCRRAEAWSESWLPQFHLPDAVMSGAYLCAGRHVNVFVATYVGNTQGRELISDGNKAVPDALRWRAAVRETSFISKDEREIGVNELQVDLLGSSALVWYWYQAGDTTATNPMVVKLEQALDLLLMRRADSVAYVLHTAVDGTVDTTRERLAGVARELTAHDSIADVQKLTLVERNPPTTARP